MFIASSIRLAVLDVHWNGTLNTDAGIRSAAVKTR
jgi:hypothetical protein